MPSSREKFYCDKCAALFYGPPITVRLPVAVENRRRTSAPLKRNLLSLSLSRSSPMMSEETRDNSPPPPLSTYSYENVEHDFVFTDPTFDENPV